MFTPRPRDPHGIHGVLLNEIGTEDCVLGSERPFTVVTYAPRHILIVVLSRYFWPGSVGPPGGPK